MNEKKTSFVIPTKEDSSDSEQAKQSHKTITQAHKKRKAYLSF